MAYENEIHPTRPGSESGRRLGDASNYAGPFLALLVILGLGIWFASTPVTTTSSTTTMERTSPGPLIAPPTTPAPTTPSK